MTTGKKTAAVISSIVAGLVLAFGGGGAGGFILTNGTLEATYATKAELQDAKEVVAERLDTKYDKIEGKIDKLSDEINSLRRDLWRQGERDRFTSTNQGGSP